MEVTIPAELFQILKDDAVKVLHSICQQIWKTQQFSLTFSMEKAGENFKETDESEKIEKVEEPENKLPTSVGLQKKQGNSRKASTFASLIKAFDKMCTKALQTGGKGLEPHH